MRFTLLILLLSACSVAGASDVQEPLQLPSQKTKEAVHKLGQAPSMVSKGLETLRAVARAKLQKSADERPAVKNGADDLLVPVKEVGQPEAARFSPDGKRDPFRPATMRTGPVSRPLRQNISPLERFELGQLKVVGVVWDIKEPRAMIEDSEGLGYIVKVGTPMGVNEGKVKAIGHNAIVIEEFYVDSHGARKKREVNMRLATE
jgi:Tfp pilus assembly protein PilP